MNTTKDNCVIDDKNASQLLTFEHITKCPLCGKDNFTQCFSVEKFGFRFVWVKCFNCSFIFQSKRLTHESLETIYQSLNFWKANDIKNGEKIAGYDDYIRDENIRLMNMNRRLKIIKKRYLDKGNLLDIGAASGTFIKESKKYGFVAQGIEVSHDMASLGRDKDNLDIITGDFEAYPFQQSYFDLITMWDADNIFREPISAFKKVKDCLKPKGYFIFNYFDNELYNKVMRGRLSQYRDCHTLNIYNDRTIKMILKESGLNFVSKKMQWGHIKLERLFEVFGLRGFFSKVRNGYFQSRYLLVPMYGFFEVAARKGK